MNINDIDAEELWEKAIEIYGTYNPIAIIFARQAELMEKYLVIEASIFNEELIEVPVNIHSAKGQRVLKERAWWTTEELVEALDAIIDRNETKFLEELSDALHFLTELWILAGLDYSIIPSIEANPFSPMSHSVKDLSPRIMGVITGLGRAMWQLRNKPWKKSQVLTDVPRFISHLETAYVRLLWLYSDQFGLSMKQICLFYLRKSEVNLFRQRSNY